MTVDRIPTSVRLHLALYLAGFDPRCWSPDHNVIQRDKVPCPVCHRDVMTYADAIGEVWP